MQPGISTITLGVDDLQAAVAFYRDGLGLPTKGIIASHVPHGEVAFFQLQPGLKLALWPRASLAKDAGLPVGPASATEVLISHNVAARDDVEAVLDRARQAGATVLKEPGPAFWGGHTAYFQDPDGHLWEIVWNPKWQG
ncbi:VOC family protein [Paracandidimonas soli]|uniref:VOC domain-containing protein n=1 Tax=Paracandidimonas soli TaxID=1917182 RepID=A0A4R3UUH6_9BURK|nr:VOC family protein [Paracandidimonas soli]TCU94540.1 hypothetical protein EV686_10995 [Paracandidimonas soli]